MTIKEILELGAATQELHVNTVGNDLIWEIADLKCGLNDEVERINKRQKMIAEGLYPEGYKEGDKIPRDLAVEVQAKINAAMEEYLATASPLDVSPLFTKEDFLKVVKATEKLTLNQISIIKRFLVKSENSKED